MDLAQDSKGYIVDKIEFLDELATNFEKLPGVGKKTALRYAYSIIEKMDLNDVEKFANSLIETKKKVNYCKKCGVLTTKETCEICNDSDRDRSKILVVKDTKDVFAIERTNQYQGLYHVLGGLINPLEGIGPDKINIKALEERAKNKEIKEVIIATTFTPSGETTALFLEKILKRENLTISLIGYGLPAGGDIEYIDELTLKRALQWRNKI